MHRRNLTSLRVIALSVLAAVLMAACGGGGDDDTNGESFEGETVRSEDGRLTVQVPEGAAADGVEVTIALIEDGDLPAELRDSDEIGVVGYELSPDGAEFSEPLTVTFRLDPAELGLELPEGGVPLGLLLTRDAAGEFESLEGAVLSREDGLMVARGTMSHFSVSFFIWSDEHAVVLDPDSVDLIAGETVFAEALAVEKGDGPVFPIEFSELAGFAKGEGSFWKATAPFSTESLSGETVKAAIGCSASTNGVVVSAAYRVEIVPVGLTESLSGLFFGTRPPFISLEGDGICRGAATPDPSSTAAGGSTPTAQGTPRSSRNSHYEIEVKGADGSAPVNKGDTFNRNGPYPEAAPQLDIVRLDWSPVDGSPDLLQLDVYTAGPLDKTVGTILLQISVAEASSDGNPEDPRIGATLEITDGTASCRLNHSSRSTLNADEACEVTADGHLRVVLNLSEMPPGALVISLVALPLEGAGAGEDSVTIKGITRP
jgi:hypothetical protein